MGNGKWEIIRRMDGLSRGTFELLDECRKYNNTWCKTTIKIVQAHT